MPIYVGNTQVKPSGYSKVYVGNTLVYEESTGHVAYIDIPDGDRYEFNFDPNCDWSTNIEEGYIVWPYDWPGDFYIGDDDKVWFHYDEDDTDNVLLDSDGNDISYDEFINENDWYSYESPEPPSTTYFTLNENGEYSCEVEFEENYTWQEIIQEEGGEWATESGYFWNDDGTLMFHSDNLGLDGIVKDSNNNAVDVQDSPINGATYNAVISTDTYFTIISPMGFSARVTYDGTAFSITWGDQIDQGSLEIDPDSYLAASQFYNEEDEISIYDDLVENSFSIINTATDEYVDPWTNIVNRGVYAENGYMVVNPVTHDEGWHYYDAGYNWNQQLGSSGISIAGGRLRISGDYVVFDYGDYTSYLNDPDTYEPVGKDDLIKTRRYR